MENAVELTKISDSTIIILLAAIGSVNWMGRSWI